ncbi:ATP-binding protein [Agrobacterium sp. 22094]|uniref:ATP-binding protein n=1 Tax=Agrobacterium sp. 22094 TaxID=3453872 RepID=UPI003F86027F
MLTDEDLTELYFLRESDRVERKASAADGKKIRDAICAFGNDLPNYRRPGVLFVGQNDDLSCSGLEIDDALLLKLSSWSTSGNIMPIPSVTIRAVELGGCTVAAVIVEPSDNPPLRHGGEIRIRVGPTRGLATPEQERRLVEKRRWGNLPYDLHQVPRATVADIDLVRFQNEYLPSVVSREHLDREGRDQQQELVATRVCGQDGLPTVAGILLLGKDPRAYFPGAYIDWRVVRGTSATDETVDTKEISGSLFDQVRRIEELISATNKSALALEDDRHTRRETLPSRTLQQLVRNAIMHRNYEATNAPIRVTWYTDKVEILSPGGPYGAVTRENFGQGATDYRNPTIAQAFKSYGFVERFGIGIPLAREALSQTGAGELIFEVNDTYTNVTIRHGQ